MSLFLLTSEQKELLRTLLGYLEAGKLKEPITPFPAGNPTTQFAIHLRGENSFKFKRISDLDSLCDAGLMRYRWNRLGTGKLYYLTEAGATAVANDFQAAKAPFGQNLSLVLLTKSISGGQINLEGIKENLTLGEIADDPLLRHTAVTYLISSLQRCAEDLLPWSEFRDYYQVCQRLQEELLSPKPQNSRFQELFKKLAAPQANLTDWPQLWALLFPLLMIAQLRCA